MQPRKRFGQHFLRDARVVERIVQSIRPVKDEWLVEIGPGEGVLTEALLAQGAKVHAVEIDRDLARPLLLRFPDRTRFRLETADALRFDFSSLCKEGSMRVVGNLPYNISTPLMFHLFDQGGLVTEMVFMLQREVVDRLCAGPGDSAYGRLSVMTAYHAEAEPLFDVFPESFHPPPRVMSSVVRLTPHRTPPVEVNPDRLARLVGEAFMQRRKTLRNALRRVAGEADFEAASIDPAARAETLSLADFARLSNRLETLPQAGSGDDARGDHSGSLANL